jgi:hypothetical protein
MGMNHQQRMRALENLANVNAALRYAGSAEVLRPLTLGDRKVRRGEVLTREELERIAPANLKAMAANRWINLRNDPARYRAHTERSDNALRSRTRKSRRNLQKRRTPTAEKA